MYILSQVKSPTLQHIRSETYLSLCSEEIASLPLSWLHLW